MENRQVYIEILRELIRSQMLHLVEQLSGTGEECFLVSAARDDETPHLIGSIKGLGYMKGFTGVQEGFLHYLQKSASKPESHQVSRSDNNEPESHQASRSDASMPELHRVSSSDASMPELHRVSSSDASKPESHQVSRSDASKPESHQVSRSDASKPESHQVSRSDASKPESHQVSRSDASKPESHQVSRSDASKPESHQMSRSDASILKLHQSSVSDASVLEPDEVSVSDASVMETHQASKLDVNSQDSHEGSRSVASIPDSHEASQSDASKAEPHQAVRSVGEQQTDSKPVSVSTVLSHANETCESEPVRSNANVTLTSKPMYAVKIESLKEDRHAVISSGSACGNKLQTSEQDVVQEQPAVDAASVNFLALETQRDEMNKENEDEGQTERNALEEKCNPKESFIIEFLTDQTVKLPEDIASVVTSTGRSVETKMNGVVSYQSQMSAETLESDDEESDMDFDENDFDEMEEEEIFSQLINDFKDKEKVPRKMHFSEVHHKDTDSVKSNKNTNTENVKSKYPEGLGEETNSSKTNAATLVNETVESRMDISPVNGEDTVQVKVIVTGETKAKQVYKFKNNVFSMKEILKPEDLVCNYCKKNCRTIKEVREHEGSHTKRYDCYKCDKYFESQKKLRTHNAMCFEIPELVKDYFKENPSCTPKRRWTIHKKRKSEVKNSPPFDIRTSENDLSSSTFERSAAVKGVLYDKYSQKQLFECEVCFKKFKFRISLKKHACRALSDKAGKAESSASADRHILDTTDKEEKLVGDKLGTCKEKIGKDTWSYRELLEWQITDKTCPFPNCGRKFSCKGQVQDHLVTHTSERPFKCHDCSKCFKYNRDLTHHKKEVHWHKRSRKTQRSTGSKAVKIANQILARRSSVKMSKGLFQGGGSPLPASANLVNKTQMFGQVRDPAQGALKTVAKQNASKLKSNIKNPSQTANTKAMVKKYSDERIRKYKCPYCEKRYFSNSHLSEHVVKHTGEKNFKCSLCDQKILMRWQFDGHKKQCELANPGKVSNMIRLNAKQKGKSACKKLNIETRQDIKSCVNRSSEKMGAKKKTLKSMSDVNDSLEIAKRIKLIENSSMSRCNICGSEFKSLEGLRLHLLGQHLVEKLYRCSCGERFYTSKHRLRHMKKTGCKSVKTANKYCCVERNAEVKLISNGESRKENSFNDTGTEPDHDTVHSTEPGSECEKDKNLKDAKETGIQSSEYESVSKVQRVDQVQQKLAEHATRKDYQPSCVLPQAISPCGYICSICDARFSTAYEIVQHNNKKHS
ncbi:zinc finger protein 62 homolog isoform X2 [Mercenaria mercenaria]|nr:zinc finger protein 62 homolog isoform X2 [Mercenaria mercenaria]